MIRVTRDHLERKDVDIVIEEMPLYALERIMGENPSIPTGDLPMVRFRMYDDDGIPVYSGELSDDDDCENQSAALRWGETDSGCTVIKVVRNGRLVQEIA